MLKVLEFLISFDGDVALFITLSLLISLLGEIVANLIPFDGEFILNLIFSDGELVVLLISLDREFVRTLSSLFAEFVTVSGVVSLAGCGSEMFS